MFRHSHSLQILAKWGELETLGSFFRRRRHLNAWVGRQNFHKVSELKSPVWKNSGSRIILTGIQQLQDASLDPVRL